MKRMVRTLLGIFTGTSLLTALSIGVAAADPLTLVNGWTNSPFATSKASVWLENGIVRFKGAIGSGTSGVVFTLPEQFIPASDVYIPVDLCNATNGRLHIAATTGVVDVEEENGTFSNAQCFTSLDGAWFSLTLTGFRALTLKNGWTNGPFATRSAAMRNFNGIVRFQGAIATGTNNNPFNLPATFRPTTDVYIPIDLCNGTNGRLIVQPTGLVTIEAEGGTFSNAQCFTSLDGASFALNTSGIALLTLINGWTNQPFSTAKAAVRIVDGTTVQFQGGIATTGTNPVPFRLPVAFRPSQNVYVKVDLCNATNGRLVIAKTGFVTVQAEGGTFSNAQCFTSLEGVSFRL